MGRGVVFRERQRQGARGGNHPLQRSRFRLPDSADDRFVAPVDPRGYRRTEAQHRFPAAFRPAVAARPERTLFRRQYGLYQRRQPAAVLRRLARSLSGVVVPAGGQPAGPRRRRAPGAGQRAVHHRARRHDERHQSERPQGAVGICQTGPSGRRQISAVDARRGGRREGPLPDFADTRFRARGRFRGEPRFARRDAPI